MEKKTVVITVKTSPTMRQRAAEIIARTGPGTLSRYIRAALDDLISKHDAGERLAEPPQFLTERQRDDLAQLAHTSQSAHTQKELPQRRKKR